MRVQLIFLGLTIHMKQKISIEPIQYFPVSKKPFEFSAGLRKINVLESRQSEQIFQIDNQWRKYRAAKLEARKENFEKYVCKQDLDESLVRNLCAFIIDQLSKNYPQYFSIEQLETNIAFYSTLSSEKFTINQFHELIDVDSRGEEIQYADLLDALVCQLQEDISLSSINADEDRISYLHLCFPNFWAAQDKIGESFISAHAAVPAMEKISENSRKIIKLLVNSGPFERFTWGITTDDALNQHPEKQENSGRDWSDPLTEYYLRIERQVTVPFSRHDAFLFAIRTYIREIRSLNDEEIKSLIYSLGTMPEQVGHYKGLKNTDKRSVILRLKAAIPRY